MREAAERLRRVFEPGPITKALNEGTLDRLLDEYLERRGIDGRALFIVHERDQFLGCWDTPEPAVRITEIREKHGPHKVGEYVLRRVIR